MRGMTESELWREALAAAAGHARAVRVIARPVLQRVERAAVSGAAISRSELASAGLLRRELDQAEARVHRLREAARQRTGG
jgi:hypothetical protein